MTLSAVPPAERAALYRSTSILLRKCGLSAGRALSTDALGVLGVELYGVVLQHAALNVPGRAAAMGRSGASSGNELLGSPAKKQKTGKGGLDLPSQVCAGLWGCALQNAARTLARACSCVAYTVNCMCALLHFWVPLDTAVASHV